MRQTEIGNILKDHEVRLKKLEEKLIVKMKYPKSIIKIEDKVDYYKDIQEKQKKESIPKESGVTIEKSIPEKMLKENYNKNVETKGLPKTKYKVSTNKSGDGESSVDTIKEKNEKTK